MLVASHRIGSLVCIFITLADFVWFVCLSSCVSHVHITYWETGKCCVAAMLHQIASVWMVHYSSVLILIECVGKLDWLHCRYTEGEYWQCSIQVL